MRKQTSLAFNCLKEIGSKFLKSSAVPAVMVAISGAAQAELFDRGGGMIYDSTSNIIWLADMNYAQTSGYDSDGLMTWPTAKLWAENLVYGGYNDWRLPTLNPSDTTCSNSVTPLFNCTGGEMSQLFVGDLGNKAGESVLNQAGDTDTQKANLALFSNVQSGVYWSGTEFAPPSVFVWTFGTYNGGQFYAPNEYVSLYGVAVRPVPEPQTYAMLLLGLSALVVAVRLRPS